jgi:hypothetical protein
MTDISTETSPSTSPASAVASSAAAQTTRVAGTAADEAKAVAEQAAEEAKNLLADARTQLRDQANEQSDRIATALHELSEQLRRMAGAGEPGMVRDVVQQAADKADGVATRLGDGGLERAMDDARRFARNRPGLFLAGAAVAGLVAGRVIRNVDTTALTDAAKPNGSGDGDNGQHRPDRTFEAPAMTPVEGGAPRLPTSSSPVAAGQGVAEPQPGMGR